MKEKVLSEIRKYNLIEHNDNIVIGVSGGPDSMALLYILLELQDKIEFNIYIAHLNHGVRGKDALRDQKFVKLQSEKLDLPYFTKNVDMIAYGIENGITSEEAGRELRYGFFREIIRTVGSGKIAVAHNKNDQAETLIMRFIRGTGIDGLKGMEYISDDIIRPILGISRDDIEKYITLNHIETVSDMTNFQAIYNRNKVRLELIPYIEEHFNPNIIATMWRTSELSALDSDFLNIYTKDIYRKIIKNKDASRVVLDVELFLELHSSIKQRIIRHSILELSNSLQGITEAQISNTLDLIEKEQTGKEVHLSNNIIVKTNYDEIIVQIRDEEDKDYLYDISYPGVANLYSIGYYLNIDVISMEDYLKEKIDNNTRFFDLDRIKGNLTVRNRKPGDRFIPFGMKGSKKIKDYFIDEKVPKDKRDKIPLIVDKESILWVLGYRTDERYRITDNTNNILRISYEKSNT